MENDWSVVYKAQNAYQAEIIKGMLEENGIECVLIDKKESAYLNFGVTWVYVPENKFDKARMLILEKEDV